MASKLLNFEEVHEESANPPKTMQLMPALKKRLETESTVGNLPALTGVLADLQRYTSDPNSTITQISEQVTRDPSLSVRLLHMANSAYYNLSEEVVSMEEAVLFLGIEQIRMVSLSMNCVEKMSPQDKSGFEWTDFWRHCIATAYFSRMIGRFFHRPNADPELDYMAGLLHDVGKLVIAMLIPEGFGYVITKAREEKLSFSDAERAYFDTDHGALGGWYLERQKVPPIVSEAVRCHHTWTAAVDNQDIAAIVNVADTFCHEVGIGSSGNMSEVREPFTNTEAWYFLTQKLRLRGEVVILEKRLRDESERLGGLVDIILPKPKPQNQKVKAPLSETKVTTAPAPQVEISVQKAAPETPAPKAVAKPAPEKVLVAEKPAIPPHAAPAPVKNTAAAAATQVIAPAPATVFKKTTPASAPAAVTTSKNESPLPAPETKKKSNAFTPVPKSVVSAEKSKPIAPAPAPVPVAPEPSVVAKEEPVVAVAPTPAPIPKEEPVIVAVPVEEPAPIAAVIPEPAALKPVAAPAPLDPLLNTDTSETSEALKPAPTPVATHASDLAFEHPLLKSAS